MRLASWIIAAASLFAIAAPVPAHGYVIQTSSSGAELHFTAMPQYFFLNEDGSDDVADDSEIEAFRRAFASWEAVEMSDARFDKLDTTSRGASDVFNDNGLPGRDKLNLVVWVESGWQESPAQLAVTYTYFVDVSGKILEDDITMNGQDYTWTTGDSGVVSDVESIAAHEIGHAFGLGHSIDAEATMFATASAGETKKRTLAQDDVDAILYLYPKGCCKRHAGHDLLAALGCSVTPGARGGRGVALLVAIGAAMVVARGRRRAAGAGAVMLAVAILAAAPLAQASVAKELSVHDLVTSSEAVVRGRVVWQETSEGAKGSIVTITQIEVDEVLAGAAGAVVTIVEPGGVAPSGIGLHVSGAPRYEGGEEVVVFTEAPRGGYATAFPDALRTTAMAQGKLRVVREGGVARVVRDLSGVARVAKDGGFVSADPLHGLTLEELEARIRE